MEKIGTIRRIDELGRIVIPKLIRNKMRLKEGDRVVVSYNIEDDTVTVSIHDTYIHNMKELSLIIDSLYKELHYHIALCSKNKVVCINSDSAYPNILNKEISLHVQEEIEKRKTSQFVHEDLNNENKYYNFFAYPLAYDSELFGCLLVFSSTTLSNEENKILMSFRNLLTTFIRQ